MSSIITTMATNQVLYSQATAFMANQGQTTVPNQQQEQVFPIKYYHHEGVNYINIEPISDESSSMQLEDATGSTNSTTSSPEVEALKQRHFSNLKQPHFTHVNGVQSERDLRFSPTKYNLPRGVQHINDCAVVLCTEASYNRHIHFQCEPATPLSYELFTATPVEGPKNKPPGWNGLQNLAQINPDLMTRFQATSTEKVSKWLLGRSLAQDPWCTVSPNSITSELALSEKSVIMCKQDNFLV